MSKYSEAIAAHEKADAAFESAIKKQFGPNANRWSVKASQFNKATMEACQAKIAASKAQYIASQS